MEKIKLNEHVSVSRIIQGTMNFNKKGMNAEDVRELMLHRISHGVTTFDTAQIYADYQNEVLIGQALKVDPSLKDQIQIITKTGITLKSSGASLNHYNTTKANIIKSCQESLEKLGVDVIDVYLIHREDPLINHQEVAEALDHCLEQGYIKSYGVSNFDPFKFDALNSKTNQKLITNQIEFSLTCFEHIDNGNMDYLQQENVKPLFWSPLSGGRLENPKDETTRVIVDGLESFALKYGVSKEALILAWLMYHPVHGAPIIGTTRKDRFESLLESMKVSIDHEDWYAMYLLNQARRLR